MLLEKLQNTVHVLLTGHHAHSHARFRVHQAELSLSAVQPATAAPLLLHGDLDVELRSDLTVLNLPAVLASRGNARCLYFSDEAAAYALYAPDAAEDVFLSLIPRLSWVEP